MGRDRRSIEIGFERLERRRLLHVDHTPGDLEAPQQRPVNPAGTIYVDVGNVVAPYDDAAGQTTWSPDAGFTGGKRVRGRFAVSGTDDDLLFSTRRQGIFTYNVPADDGTYTLSLLFVDTVKKAGRRVFHVDAEGQRIETALDIAGRVGRRAALVVSHQVTVTDGALELAFPRVRGKAVLSGISLVPVTVEAPQPPQPPPEPPAPPEPPPAPPEPPPAPVTWETGVSAPVALGEVAGGVINGVIYLLGEGSSQTFAYDVASNTWASGLAPRPHVGDHHAAEVVDGKLYLFGGFNGGSSGKVQIYDPSSDMWSLGAPMPFAAGSGSSALIGGKVYVAGGIVNFQPGVGGQTTTQAAVYDPASNTWSAIAPMPRGANHAASATDGSKFYVFGGRDGAGGVLDGFDAVQVYDPLTNSWSTSDAVGSALQPLPQARGGTGKAVFANGEFYVIGGETLTGAGATPDDVYDRVDVYNPATNAWRLAQPMPTARHGIFPLLHDNRIYVATGGTRAGNSQSTLLEILKLS